MAARSTAATPAHGQTASQLREQLQSLVPAKVGAAVTATADEANARMRQLLDYGMLALEFREPLGQLLRRITGRSNPQPARPDNGEYYDRGALPRARRHRLLLIMGAVSAGVVVYTLLQASRPALRERLDRT